MSVKISVITPTYNRGNVLARVFNSLCAQTNKEFEWIIIDDGSTDNTKEVVDNFLKEATFNIIYKYQDNNGKHIALNEGMMLASGEFIAIADSDDEFVPESFECMLSHWEDIPENERSNYRGITCRCFDPVTTEKIGININGGYVDYYGLDASYKHGFHFEMWGINRTDLLKANPFPDIRGGQKSGLRFFPETVLWDKLGRDYKVRYIDDCLRAYYRDQDNATTNKNASRANENIYLWSHLINDVLDYFPYRPIRFVKAFVGLTRDGLSIGKKYKDIVAMGNGLCRKLLIVLFSPVGFILYKKK